MALEQKLNLRLSQRLVMTPSLQQAIKLLQMSRLELQEVLTQEMVENPILEDQEEAEPAERTETAPETEDAAAPAEAAPEAEKDRDSFDEIDFDSYFSDYLDSAYNPRQYQEEPEEYSLENVLTRPEGLPEHLNWQLSMSEATPAVREVASFLIGNIDEDGYLRISRDEVKQAEFENEADVETAMELVRSFDPPGVCAFDLPDCLMLQLKALGIENALIETIIQKHWPEFLNRQFASLAKTLSVGLSEVQAAVEIIKNLEPKPGRKYSSDRTIYVEPDVFVRKIGDEYVIQLSEDGLPKLRISGAYRRLLRGGNGAIGAEAANYLREKMRSAVWLIKSLDQRQRTIYKVADSIVRHQRAFLDHGIEHLRPLVLRVVANDIGMHESTVSRVVSNKYMHTPRGLFPMKYFFHSGIDSSSGDDVSSLSIKNKISRIVQEEDSRRPFSDARIMQRLRAEGIQIARRTVAKYREELRIPSSSQRKQSF
jgi:RNA polymerase sigma-54 factor